MHRLKLAIVASFLASCANIVMPTGGPKDETPPKMIAAQPQMEALNFSTKEITITMDEYFSLKDQQNITFTPDIVPRPELEVKNKSLHISIKPQLLPNTTYTINFGNTIIDKNESNPMPNFKYVFSTGSFIDSLVIKGNAKNYITDDPSIEYVAGLYNSDSSIENQKPIYYTKTDKTGNFELSNLPAKPFYLAIFLDKNKNNSYDYGEPMGFNIAALEPDTGRHFTQIITCAAALEPNRLIDFKLVDNQKISLLFDHLTDTNLQVKTEPNIISMLDFAPKDTVFVYLSVPFTDSIMIDILHKNGFKAQVTLYSSSAKVPVQVAPYLLKEKVMAQPFQAFELQANEALMEANNSQIEVLEDSVLLSNTAYTIEGRSIKSNIKLKPGARYIVRLGKNFIYNKYNVPAKTDTFSFKVPALEELSTLEVANLDSIIGKNRVLLLLDEAYNLKQAIPIAGDKVLFQLLPPGKYRLAVLEDLNIDLKPTPSNFKNRTQPETVHKHSETVILRSNWEHEVQFSEKK